MFTERYGLYTSVYGLRNNLLVMYINTSKPNGHYMNHQFNIQEFYVLPAQCIYVFCMDL